MGKFGIILLVILINVIFVTNFALAYEKEINAISATMAEKIAASGKKTIAVVDFTDLEGNVTKLGRFLAEEFSVSLADAGKGFEVVDRTHLKSIIKEHKLSSTGIIDSSTARKLGKIIGVESLITGTITPFGDTIRIAVKILDTTTAKIIGASRVNLAKIGALVDLDSEITTPDRVPMAPKPVSTPTGKTTHSVTIKGTKFDLKSCERQGKSLIFKFSVTSLDKDKEVAIHVYTKSAAKAIKTKTRFFDIKSIEYDAKQIKLANKISQKSIYSTFARNLMLKDLPGDAEILFEGVPPEVSVVAMLEVSCGWKPLKEAITFQLKNIPVTPKKETK